MIDMITRIDAPVTKERLKKYKRLKEEIGRQYERYIRLKAASRSPALPVLDGMPHSGFVEDRMAIAVARQIELENIILENLRKEAAEVAAIEEAIQLLEDPGEREVLRLRYIEGLGWLDICAALTYEWAQTHRLHGSALSNIVAVSCCVK